MKGSKLRKLVIITGIVAGVSFTAAGIVALSTGIYSTKDGEGSVLYIYTERNKNISLGYFENRLVLELKIPENYRHRLTVHSVSGVIELNDQILSILTISSTSGDVYMTLPVSGNITVTP